jgi:hypothetical protein
MYTASFAFFEALWEVGGWQQQEKEKRREEKRRKEHTNPLNRPA